MIEMRVGDEDEIDLGQMMNQIEARFFRRLITLSHFDQFGSIRTFTSASG